MEPYIEQRAVQLLRESRTPSVPVRVLYGALTAEAGAAVGSYARLVADVRHKAELFVVLDTEHPLGPETGWPAATRSEYEAALSAAGIAVGPHITLTGPADQPDDLKPGDDCGTGREPGLPLHHLHDSLMRVWEIAAGRPGLRRVVAAALADVGAWPAQAGSTMAGHPDVVPSG